MSNPKPKAASSKVFDVAKPGKSAPAASSRPIIVTNRPVLQDPMMVSSDDNADPDKIEKPLSPSKPGKLKIEPISHDEAPAAAPAVTPGAATTASDTARPTEPAAPPQESSPPLPAPESSESQAKAPEPSEAATPQPKAADDEVTDSETEDTVAPAKKDEETLHKETERAAELDKLAESHKYYLPINQVEKRRNVRSALLGLVLVIILGLAWADVSLDAGIISIPGVKPLTHFFN